MSRLLAFFLYLALVVICIALGINAVVNYLTLTRGVEPLTTLPSQTLGTNTDLQQYARDDDPNRALELVKGAGLTAIRQEFPWREIEPTRGNFDWAKWDYIVNRAHAANLQILAVLDTAPAWSQRENERDLPNAPPANFDDYARFAAEFAKRYGAQISAYEIWDEPNIHPNWGRRNADPVEYAQLLHAGASAIRANDPTATIVLAGLGMNLETQRPHFDYSEILFLRGLYENGAQTDFDVVAAKPFGLWSGPEDRRVSTNELNFARVILLREEMKHYGDAAKPVWAVDMGWNALPSDWQGAPSPWGSASEEVQAGRLNLALIRARSEWRWLTALFVQTLQPAAPPDDPRWGFALVTRDLQPRAAYNTLAAFTANPPPVVPPPNAPWFSVALLVAVALVATWRGARIAAQLPIAIAWGELEKRFLSLPEFVQLAILALGVGAFYLSSSVPLGFILLALLIPLLALRLDLALALDVFTIPFFLYPKTLFSGFQLSLVETLMLVCAAAWEFRTILNIMCRQAALASRLSGGRRTPGQAKTPSKKYQLSSCLHVLASLSALDWAVLAFVLLGIISARFAENFGVAAREFRVIVLEPALLYALIRLTHLSLAQLWRLINALLSAGAVVCIIGLIQFLTGDVIVASGFARVHGVWESPNNAALFLGRLLPMALAFALILTQRHLRWVYAVLAALLALTIYLTFSFGGLFIGVPASILFLAVMWLRQRRVNTRVVVAALVGALLLAAIVLIPLTTSERFQKLFETGTGTGFFRVAVWTSALRMIGDHPLLGVGLDNFLYEYPKYILPEAWREPNLSHPHNVVLDFWVRLGVFGVVVLAWMLFEFFRRGRRAFQSADVHIRALALGLMASMVDFLAHGMIDAAYFVVDLAFVFMLSLAVMGQMTNDERRRTEGEKRI